MTHEKTANETHVTGGPPVEHAGIEKVRTLAPLLVLVVALIVGELFLRFVLNRPADFRCRGCVGAEVEVVLFRCRTQPGRRVLFVGDSRTAWGVDPRAVEAGCAANGIPVVAANIAVEGEAATWSLGRVLDRRLQPDVVVINGSAWNLAPFATVDVSRPPYVSPGEMLNYLVEFPIRNHVRVLKGIRIGKLLMRGGVSRLRTPPPRRWQCRLGSHVALFVDPARSARFEREMKRFRAQLTTIKADRLDAHAAAIAALIRELDARGVTVVLVRLPTGPTLRGIENAAFDYDAFVAAVEAQCPVVVWPGESLRSEYEGRIADMSHFSADTARDFSRRLGELLVERGILTR